MDASRDDDDDARRARRDVDSGRARAMRVATRTTTDRACIIQRNKDYLFTHTVIYGCFQTTLCKRPRPAPPGSSSRAPSRRAHPPLRDARARHDAVQRTSRATPLERKYARRVVPSRSRRRRRDGDDDDSAKTMTEARSRRLTASPVRRAQRNIEIGRVALCNLKADKRYGKLLVIVDVVDMNRVRARDGAIRARDDADPNTRDPRTGDGGRATGTNERRTDDEIDFARDRRCSSPRRVSGRM